MKKMLLLLGSVLAISTASAQAFKKGVLFTSNFHFAQYIRVPSNLDLYGGLSLGYYHWAHTSKYRWLKPYYDSGVALRLQSGARWFFTQNFGVNAEWFLDHNSFADLGLKLGVTYKFK